MKHTSPRNRTGLLIALTLVLLTALGIAVGKYTATREILSSEITVTARLADSITVVESAAERNGYGVYELDTSKTVLGNNYTLIPGENIPKDPRVVIEGKTPIPAYLYLKVRTMINSSITYELCDHWVPTGKPNEYIYSDAKGNAIEITETPDDIDILKANTVYISQHLLSGEATNLLEFTATLSEPTE